MALLLFVRTIGTLSILSALLHAQRPEAPAAEEPLKPIELLEEADLVAAHFSPAERADLLLSLANASGTRERKRTEAWALDLFQISTRQLDDSLYRRAMQKNALTALSAVNPLRAADLYEFQDPPAKPLPNEDFRAFGTRLLFPRLWVLQGPASVERIQQIATWLGSTGQFPYAAMADLIPKIAERDRDKASELFGLASYFYERDPGFFIAPREYINFLRRTWKIPDRAVAGAAVQQAWASLDKIEKDPNRHRMRYDVSWAGRSATFSSEADFLRARLFHVVREIDLAWADQLLKKDSGWKSRTLPAEDEGVRIAAAASVEPGTTETRVRSALNEHRTFQATLLAENDPEAAWKLVNSLDDPEHRLLGQAAILPAYAKTKAADAPGSISDLDRRLEHMKPTPAKLKILVGLAGACFATGREQDGVQYWDQAFDLGEELFSQDQRANPGKMAYASNGFDEVLQLARMRSSSPSLQLATATRIRQMDNALLKARALVALAESVYPPDRSAAQAKR
ncbi:MAG: hypothetical protein ACKV22_29640 [Bryobacteraceae bacterium]